MPKVTYRVAAPLVLALIATLLVGMPSASAADPAYVPSAAPSLNGNGTSLRLSAIDCTSVGNCVAVGSDGSSGAIEVETNGVWKVVPFAARTADDSTNLVAVSCPSPGACVAVGSAGSQGIVMTQSGNTWRGTLITGASGLLDTTYQGSLTSVDCPAVGSCVAVGQAAENGQGTYGLIANLVPDAAPATGSTWSAQKAPEHPSGIPGSASLASVSCSAPGQCRAVGYAEGSWSSHSHYALIDDEVNGIWNYGAAAFPADGVEGPWSLVSISCIGTTFICMAAGTYSTSQGTRPMIQTIDAHDTAQVTTNLLPIMDTSASFTSTSCASDGTCQSVGNAFDNVSMALDPDHGYGWDGFIVNHTYGAVHSPGVVSSNTHSPADANTVQHNETLNATSCVSGGVCVAVGSYVDQNSHEAGVIVTRHYDADGNIASETNVRAPMPADDPVTDDQSLMNGVNCLDATHCVAVGTYLNDTDRRGVIDTLGGSTGIVPSISRVSPNQGSTSGGARVTINGQHLSGVTSVTFGGKLGTGLRVISPTQLTVVVPSHAAGTVDVRVRAGATSSPVVIADRYRYITPPQVTGVSPARGSHRGGTTVTITGRFFSGATRVLFGNASGIRIRVRSATRIVVTAPAHAVGVVDVRVVGPGGTSSRNRSDRYRFV